MDLGLAAGLDLGRRDLAEQKAAFEARLDLESALTLRPTLLAALESLKRLHEDDEVWQVARSAAGAPGPVDVTAPVHGYADSLPALLTLFGYREPPPPPARQLVEEALQLLGTVGEDKDPAAEVDAARRALGELLDRTLPLAEDTLEPPSWEVARAAAEVIPALEAGTTVAVAAATGAIGAAVAASVLAAAATGGLGALAGMLVVGGVRRWRRARAAQDFTTQVAQHREDLHVGLLPAAQGAVLHHLDAVAALLGGRAPEQDPLIRLDLRCRLEALLGVTRRFAIGEQHLTAQATQAGLKGDDGPLTLVALLREVHGVARDAEVALSSGGRIGPERTERLATLRTEVKTLTLG